MKDDGKNRRKGRRGYSKRKFSNNRKPRKSFKRGPYYKGRPKRRMKRGSFGNKRFGKPYRKTESIKETIRDKNGKAKKPKKEIRNIPAEVKRMIEKDGFSFKLAVDVYNEKITYEEALKIHKEKEERRKKAEEICKKYKEIDFNVACQLVKLNKSPEEYLKEREEKKKKEMEKMKKQKEMMEKDETQKLAFEKLTEYCKNGTVLNLAKYGERFQRCVLLNFSPYEFVIKVNEYEYKLHKLNIKYFCEDKDAQKLRKEIMIDKKIKEKKLRPAHKPSDRYQIPEVILKEGNEVLLALHEGEMIRGVIEWFTPYDIFLKTRSDIGVWIFRHAVIDATKLK